MTPIEVTFPVSPELYQELTGSSGEGEDPVLYEQTLDAYRLPVAGDELMVVIFTISARGILKGRVSAVSHVLIPQGCGKPGPQAVLIDASSVVWEPQSATERP